MKAEDLRIGNLVYCDLGLPSLSVHTLILRDFKDLNETLAIIEPIPITETWLNKQGFKGTKGASWERLIQREHFVFHANQFYYTAGFSCRIGNYIKYVHQLQNLYFALTGFELKLK